MSSKPANPIVIRQGMEIGKISAEADDDYLFECFIETNAYNELIAPESPTMIVLGRTGAGKTAILRMIERNSDACLCLDPFEISMGYVANSDILRFLNDIGADLDLLFQVLWKHVLFLEFIRMKFKVDNNQKLDNFIARLQNTFRNDSKKQRAINYLLQYRDKFWIDMDENVHELIRRLLPLVPALPSVVRQIID